MKILEIKEGTFDKGSWSGYDGFIITLYDGTQVCLGISNGQSCCENWGYLMSEDSLEEFIGAEYIGVEVVDSALSHVKMRDMYEGSCMFVNISTSNGLLQFVAYNEHNGYYGHSAVVVVDGTVQHSEIL